MEQLTLSWEEVEEALKTLADAIKRDFDPNLIVGVARGGLIPAVKLSHFLGDKLLRIIHVKYYNKSNTHMKKPKLLADVDKVEGQVLIVDDVADTGASLEFVIDHLKEKGAEKIRVATIAFKPKSRVRPDYFVHETEKWVVFPWEKTPESSG